MDSKRRAALRAQANGIDTIVHIGKGAITPSVIAQAEEAILKRELIKLRVLPAAFMTARQACEDLCLALSAEPIQVIGTRFVLYRENPELHK